jgi:hypothetical protein
LKAQCALTWIHWMSTQTLRFGRYVQASSDSQILTLCISYGQNFFYGYVSNWEIEHVSSIFLGLNPLE